MAAFVERRPGICWLRLRLARRGTDNGNPLGSCGLPGLGSQTDALPLSPHSPGRVFAAACRMIGTGGPHCFPRAVLHVGFLVSGGRFLASETTPVACSGACQKAYC